PDQGEPSVPTHRRPCGRSLVYGQLLAQREVLEGQLPVASAEEREEPKQVEQEGDHRVRIVSGLEPTDQPLGRRTEYWRRTTHELSRARPEPEDWDNAAGGERHHETSIPCSRRPAPRTAARMGPRMGPRSYGRRSCATLTCRRRRRQPV